MGEALLGRVIDGFGRPLDGRELPEVCWKDYDAMPPPAMVRQPITQPLMTGIRAIDSVATCGEGQRVGIFLLLAWGKARFWRCCVMLQTQTAMFWC
ncbi:type III secretion system ATPase SsaN [Salmonella enterica subsp. enterica serovar Heidelberg str. 77-2823]|nr:type III secretion system ATPase SsaN [Salmonella enterica subsp. enterica serovar Heidelberg str. 77-2823]